MPVKPKCLKLNQEVYINMKTKIVTYDAEFYHNGHGMQRDRMLIEMYGEEWLREKKAQGLYGGDWPEEMVGKPKEFYEPPKNTTTEVVRLESLEDLENHARSN